MVGAQSHHRQSQVLKCVPRYLPRLRFFDLITSVRLIQIYGSHRIAPHPSCSHPTFQKFFLLISTVDLLLRSNDLQLISLCPPGRTIEWPCFHTVCSILFVNHQSIKLWVLHYILFLPPLFHFFHCSPPPCHHSSRPPKHSSAISPGFL